MWLAYWFFYFYNDYDLVGPFIKAGLHEGDWEMIQLRLDPAGAVPDLADYAQHRHAAPRSFNRVERMGDQPVVYPCGARTRRTSPRASTGPETGLTTPTASAGLRQSQRTHREISPCGPAQRPQLRASVAQDGRRRPARWHGRSRPYDQRRGGDD